MGRAWLGSHRVQLCGPALSLQHSTAAARPYSVMWWINQSPLRSGKMCAQGASAGGGAVAYGLVWYGAYTFLTNVELLSGPPFSNIQQGCQFPNFPSVTVCAAGQYGCSSSSYGNTQPFTNNPQYVDPVTLYLYQMRIWTNDATCQIQNEYPPCPTCMYSPTTTQSNQNWLNMSIVNGQGGTFTYPNTALAQWACSGNYASNCSPNSLEYPNNSAAQAQLFAENFSSASTKHYSLTGITGCNGEEGVTGQSAKTPNGTSGGVAIQTDMNNFCQ